MRKLIVSLHTSLDGYVGGPNGEMDWINIDDEIFDFVADFTEKADTALYGRITYEMMDNYWPTAANKTNATKHDLVHSAWYNNSKKIVISRTIKEHKTKTVFIADNISSELKKLKSQPGKNILLFGSPSVVHYLAKHQLVDEYWLFVNPIILGRGIPLFVENEKRTELQLSGNKSFNCGVIALHYVTKS
jgi:dihydrofolate reductase